MTTTSLSVTCPLVKHFLRSRGGRIVAMLMVLVLSACNGASSPSPAPSAAVTIAEFPEGVGRGYPTARLLDDGDTAGEIRAGAPAPDFVVMLENGGHLRLSDLQGHPVVINFWATWCGPCRAEMPELMRVAATDSNLVVLAVNVQEEQTTVAAFAEEFAMTTPVVIDSQGVIRELYEVRGLPTTVFIDKNGRIGAIYAGALTPTTLEERLASIRG